MLIVLKLDLAKRLTQEEKIKIINSFKDGDTIENLSSKFNCSNSTVIRNIKREVGETIYKELVKKNKDLIQKNNFLDNNNSLHNEISLEAPKNEFTDSTTANKINDERNLQSFSEFIEISPLNFEIENAPRKEFSSVPIEEIEFPKNVYMIVDKKIELEIKLLKDFPEWEFLPDDDLNRKTIEIFFDLKLAKKSCNKEQKVLKVPNADVFRITAPFLLARGISRIVCAENLIAL